METIYTGIAGARIDLLTTHRDPRGWLAEAFRADELDHRAAMGYLSVTLPGMARGPHEHLYQTDLFVFAGPGDFEVFLYDNRPESPTHGASFRTTLGQSRPARALVPPRVIHAYRCVSAEPGLSLNLPDKLYKGCGRAEPVDETRHEDLESSPFYAAFNRALFVNRASGEGSAR